MVKIAVPVANPKLRMLKFPLAPNTFTPYTDVVVAFPRFETFEKRFCEKRFEVVA